MSTAESAGSAFAYRRGSLAAERVPLARIAREVGTPCYVYSSAALRAQYRAFADAFAGQDAAIFYGVKANSTLAVLRCLAREGAGADVVSQGELRTALAAGLPPERILLSGVGKTRTELAFAVDKGIFQINVESAAELELLSALAHARGTRVDVALRVNPDVDARTHAKITTGRKENKFGVPIDEAPALYARGALLPGLAMRGIAVHIGSQLTSLAPYRKAFARVVELVRLLRADGYKIDRLDLGGGLGIVYGKETPPSMTAYAAAVKKITKGLGCRLIFEFGRFLVGNSGLLLAQVLYVKQGAPHRFVILDAGMTELLRPTLYGAYHAILPLKQPAAHVPLKAVDVVGPVCESGDFLALNRRLPPVEPGDFLAILSAGAYASTMASSYNGRLPAPEVMVRGARYDVVRARPGYDSLIARDRIPDWLADKA